MCSWNDSRNSSTRLGSHCGLANASWSVLDENRHSEQLRWIVAEHNAFTIPEPVLGEESGSNDFA